MIRQRNFDCAAGFCRPLLSARFVQQHPSAAIQQIWFRERPGPRRIDDDRRHEQSHGARRFARYEGVGPAGVSVSIATSKCRPIPKSTRMCRTSIRITASIAPPRSRSSPASPRTAASWSPAITAPASRPISSRSRRGSTGPACASTSTATSAVSTWSARTRSSSSDGKQVTEFRDGILPWALQHNVALVFDEYDAGRPDVMFVIQRVLEVSGRLTLLDQNKRDQAAPGVPPVLDRQHGRPRRYVGPLSRHPADQPGPDGPLVDRHHAELSAA